MTGTVTPTERIFNLAAYLKHCGPEGSTLDDLTRHVAGYAHDAGRDETGKLVTGTPEWETLRKVMQRDLKDLREVWGIDADFDERDHVYRLRPPFFTPKERAALIAAAATVDVEGIDGPPGQIGSGVSDTVADVVIRVHALVGDLRDAIDARTAVTFVHQGRRRTFHPYALGTWRGRWYVAGWDPELETMRRYRLDRIETETTLERVEGEPFSIVEWFDPDLAFELDPNAWGRDQLVRAQVAVDHDFLNAVVEEFGATVQEDAAGSGRDVVAFDVRHYEATRNRLFAFRDHVRVLTPPALVAMMRDHLAAVAGDLAAAPEGD
ncbi:MAG TPA: WYL domain-containing protein [Acidimicrobiia bacterium]|nr:WYL domain-containing protein [Acidimicrobiia bacterium]